MVAVAERPRPVSREMPALVQIRCWNKTCVPKHGKEPNHLLKYAFEGIGKVTLFLKCDVCGSYNVRTIEDGVLTN